MKKLSITLKRQHDLNASPVSRCLSFLTKFSLGTAMVALLSSVSPVLAKKIDMIDQQVFQSIEKATAVYSQGRNQTIVSGDDSHKNFNDSRLSKANNLTVPSTAKAAKVNIPAADSANLTEETLGTEEQYKKSLINPRSFVDKNKGTAIIDVSDFSQNNLIRRVPFSEVPPVSTDGSGILIGRGKVLQKPNYQSDNVVIGYDVLVNESDSVAVGYGVQVEGRFSVAVGHLAYSVSQGSIAIGGEGRYGDTPIPPEGRTIAQGEESIAIGRRAKTKDVASIALGSNAQVKGNYAIAFGYKAEATREDSMAIGHMAHAMGKSSVALGSEYNEKNEHGDDDYTTAKGDYSTALGSVSRALGYGSTAVGHRAYATEKDAVSIGLYSKANADHAIALGADSIANVVAGVAGYNPLLQKEATDDAFAWKSTYGAVSVGDIANSKTRQIGGVAAGSADTDAVNIAQLKSLQSYVDKGWKLSVDGKNAKVVGIDDTVDFAAGSSNLNITKGTDNNDIKFDLAKNITLESVTAGTNILDATGLVIANGPKIMTDGINAGGKKITGLAEGAGATDAVNFGQLNKAKQEVQEQVEKQVKEVEKQVAASSFVKQDDKTRYITIGKDTDGDKIDIANNKSETRILAGIKNGEISKDSNQAVTGSQLFMTNQNVTNLQTTATDIAKTFGGGAKYENEKWTAPTFTVKTVTDEGKEKVETYHNVAAAFEGVGSSFTNIKNEMTNQINNAITNVKGDSLVKKDATTNLINIGKEVAGAEINITNKDKKARILSGVAVGTKSTDAVNFAQLKELAKGWKINTTGNDFKDAIADGQSSVAIGSEASALGVNSMALGMNSQVKATVNSGVAIGAYSVADVSSGIAGYDPLTGGGSNKISYEWKSTLGAVSVGDISGMQSRQITGVAAGTQDTDAVNIAQLKSLQDYVNKGWKLSVNGKNDKVVGIDDSIDLATGSKNLEISKGKEDNKVKFDLAKNITLESVTAGTNTLDATGLKITSGPQITTTGINASGKKITGVLEGTDETDAVNFSQLKTVEKEVKEQVAASSFVKQDAGTKHITIGAEVEGTEINIANIKGELRTLSGVKEAKNDNEAVNKKQLEDSLKGLSKDLQSEDSAVVHYDKTDDENGTINYASVTFGGKEKTLTTLHNVADGAISSESHDAINGQQINKIGEDIAKFLGGASSFKNGVLTEPTYKLSDVAKDGKVTKSSYQGVELAFAGLDTNIKNVNDRIKEVSQGVAQDSLLWSKTDKAFSAQHGEDQERKASKITHILDGNIASGSTDAVTGGQLYSLNSTISTYLGGGTKYENGVWKAPDFKVKKFNKDGDVEEQTYHNVADAFEGINNSFTSIHNEINNEITQVVSDNLVKQEKETDPITIGKEVAGSEVNIANKDKVDRTLSGVKAAVNDNEAVNKAQLDTNINEVNNNITNKFNELTENITNVTQHVQGDALLWSKTDKAFSAQHGEGDEKADRKITHLQAGDITADSTDAVTGKQLYSMNEQLASYLGGGSGYDEKGKWSAPTFKVKKFDDKTGKETEQEYKTVAEAFEGVNQSFTNIHNEVNEQINQVVGDSLVKQNDKTHVISVGGETNGTQVSFANTDGTERTLSGVKAGELSTKSTDAVNGSQLYSMSNTLASYLGGGASYNENGEWKAPTFKVKKFDDNGKGTEQEYKTVAEAFEGVNQSFTNIHNEVNEQINQVVGDSLVKQDKKTHVISVGGEKSGTQVSFANTDGTERTLSGVKAGELSTKSTDAVNGSQLYSMSNSFASYLGGGSGYNEEGEWKAPTFKVNTVNAEGKEKNETYENVADALAGVGTSFTNVQNKITNEITNQINHLQSEDSAVVHYDKTDDENGTINYASVTFGGKDKIPTGLHNIADGNIASGSTDAITGNQLYSLNNTISTYLGGGTKYENGVWMSPDFKVKQFNKDGDAEEKTYHNVADAFAGISNTITDVHDEVNNQISQVVSDSLVKQEKETDLITIGKEVAGSEVNIANKDKSDRTLSGVKAAVNDNEAVNKEQFDKGLKDLSNKLQSDDSAVVLYDKKENGDTDYTNVTLGKGKNTSPVALHNVADGKITNGSHDAVTGGQINTLSQDLAKFLGGEAVFKEGVFTGPTYSLSKVDEKGEANQVEFKDVGSAFAGLDTNIKNVNQRIKEVSQGISDNSLLWNEEEQGFVALHGTGDAKTNSKIKHLQDGEVSAASTEAVNGSQLYSLNQTLATYFGGGTKYENGEWTAPNFKVNAVSEDGSKVEEQSYDDVAEAFASVGTSFTNLHNELKNEISQVVSDSLVKQDADTKVIKIGAEKDGTEITIANSDGAVRSLSGVKAATLSTESTEAVNGSQLYSLNQTLASYLGGGAKYENGEWTAPNFKIVSFKEDGSSEETSYDNVAAAFAGVNNSFTKLHHELSDNIEQNALLWSDAEEAFVALHGKGSEKHNSKLTHLVDGEISSGSTEAITGNQLYQLNQTLATYLGGGASYQGGQWTPPKFQVSQFKSDGSSDETKGYDNVGAAFEGVNGSLSGINDRLNNVAQNVSSNSLTWNEEVGGYDGRHNGVDSKITHVADGQVSEGSKEAVNGGQLWETNQKVAAVENRVESIDQHVKDVESAVTNGAVNYDKDEAGKKTNKITLVGGNESDPVLIDNVADGRIESGSKEAINGGQLHDYTDQQMKLVLDDAKKYTDEHVNDIVNNGVNESKAYTDMKFETLSYAVEDVRKEARQAAAIGLAVSNLRYYDIPGSLSFSFGTGIWRSQSAFAVGAGYTSEDGNIRSNLSITSAGGHWGVGAGITFRLK
ncbi:Vomp family autotransporter [Bartonella senegalensis]|uniref:Vomp family autotransporter n=1 Tax=Bartonella senegalensis TaxID=1468418 RepID=UPI0002D977D3|nr:Vomp family autotransporter [Bartonella senegalensis]